MNAHIRRILCACLIAQVVMLSACDWFSSTEQRLARAERRVAEGDDSGAAIEIKNLLRGAPANIPARLMLVELSLRLDDPKSAERDLRIAREHGATAADVAEPTGRVLLASGSAQELLLRLESRTIELQEPARRTYRGLALLNLRQWQPALEAFDAALSIDANAHLARLGRADALAALENSNGALAELKTLLASDPNNAHAWLRQGVLLVRRGDFDAATAALSAAQGHAAGQLSITQRLVILCAQIEAHLGSGRIEDAASVQAELARSAPDAPTTRLLAARIAMVRQDFASVVAESQKVLNDDPDAIPARLLMGAALLAQGSVNQAEAQLSELVRRAPENLEARKLLARVNLQLQRPEAAVQALLPAQREGETNAPVDALMGLASLQQGDTAEAVKLLERSLAADPGNDQLKLDLAFAHYAGGAYAEAVEVLRTLPASAAGDVRREGVLIAAIASAKGTDAARHEMNQLLAARPKDVDLINLAALFHARTGEFDRARQLLRKALEMRPSSSPTLRNTARVEMAASNPLAAVAALERLTALQPKDTQAALALAQASIAAGDEPKAAKTLEEARSRVPEAPELGFVLGRLYAKQGRTRDADALIVEVQRRANGRADLANGIGNYYADSGRFEQALAWFRQAAVQDPEKPGYQLDIARVQLAMGNVVEAQDTLQQTVAAYPKVPDAAIWLVRLDAQHGKLDKANERLSDLVRAYPDSAAVATLQGDMQMAARSYVAAATSYWTAFQRAPSTALALRAHSARVLAKLPNATAPLEQWLARNPRDHAALVALAESHVSRGDVDAAIRLYERETKAGGTSPMVQNNLAWLYHERGDARAEPTAQLAYARLPEIPQVADTYGWILLNAGDARKALPILQKAASESGQHVIRYHYAVALARTGQDARARQELTELTRISDAGTAKLAKALLDELGT